MVGFPLSTIFIVALHVRRCGRLEVRPQIGPQFCADNCKCCSFCSLAFFDTARFTVQHVRAVGQEISAPTCVLLSTFFWWWAFLVSGVGCSGSWEPLGFLLGWLGRVLFPAGYGRLPVWSGSGRCVAARVHAWAGSGTRQISSSRGFTLLKCRMYLLLH